MGTGTSRFGLGLLSRLGLGLAAAGLAACGGSNAAFSWLRPQPPPSAWKLAHIPSGAELAYPQGWSRVRGDRGTATAALIGSGGRFLGYLNITPRQGTETLADWPSFRVDHNREEGDRGVQRLAAATALHFLTGRGSCVKDSYTTQTGSQFIEIACLVAGRTTESVIVGAAPPGAWARQSGAIERAIAGVRT